MRWVEVVEVEAAATGVLAVGADAGRAGWAGQRPQGPTATAFARVADTGNRT